MKLSIRGEYEIIYQEALGKEDIIAKAAEKIIQESC